MRIIVHRTNTAAAFRRALAGGFGAELDVRDARGALVVSHDMPAAGAPRLEAFLKLYAAAGARAALAVNVKSCGLQEPLRRLLRRYGIADYFVFDMAVPDGLEYARLGLRLYTRRSEHEPAPAFCREAAGVWYDEFRAGRLGFAGVAAYLRAGKRVCVVSPELHGRPFAAAWRALRRYDRLAGGALELCTDRPLEADAYFNG